MLSDLLAWADSSVGRRPEVLHWRAASGQEVDFVVEHEGRLLAIEVRATSRPMPHDARHLQTFRAEYGEDVAGCLLLHAGNATFRMGEGIVAAPWWRVM